MCSAVGTIAIAIRNRPERAAKRSARRAGRHSAATRAAAAATTRFCAAARAFRERAWRAAVNTEEA
jgi:hypothetical protein